jgi:hypothetical protein
VKLAAAPPPAPPPSTPRANGLTSSKLPLLRRCGWFPTATWTDDAPGRPAIVGSAVHRLAELAIDGHNRPPGAALGAVDLEELARAYDLSAPEAARLRATAAHLLPFLAANIRLGWTTEQPFAWDPRDGSGRALPKTTHRAYDGLRPGEIGTTPDVFGWLPDHETVIIMDFKTGADVGSPAENWQLMAQAAAAVDHLGAQAARLVVVYAREDATTIAETTVDLLDLEAYRVEVLAALEAAAAPDVRPTPGEWCGSYTSDGAYCPARATCPALARALAHAAPALTPPPVFGPPENAEHAAQLVALATLAGAALRALEPALEAWADAHDGIPLPDGRTWKRHATPVDSPDLSTPHAAEVLRELGFGAAVRAATSWSAIKELAGPAGESEARAALAKIRAITTTTRTTYAAHALPKPPKPKATRAAKAAP